jgi:hypothetical protein
METRAQIIEEVKKLAKALMDGKAWIVVVINNMFCR